MRRRSSNIAAAGSTSRSCSPPRTSVSGSACTVQTLHVLPEPMYLKKERPLSKIAERLRLPEPDQWHATITPSATADAADISAVSSESLIELGRVTSPSHTEFLTRSRTALPASSSCRLTHPRQVHLVPPAPAASRPPPPPGQPSPATPPAAQSTCCPVSDPAAGRFASVTSRDASRRRAPRCHAPSVQHAPRASACAAATAAETRDHRAPPARHRGERIKTKPSPPLPFPTRNPPPAVTHTIHRQPRTTP